ncbi:hypothetical protein BOTBODRAFT_31637 [Botryobasidium botryosum FD-172 SS1]|uniref:Uncharacterized protein n=1 Tax=Botryobasidium botryosum (strain FD-172 SS1) TaxID=930990 RepID=A0A067MLZ9_BOTB1|nr:hypothetical protein BOTBODRAFT_31637 [Botryobasidium botryosum FD-172 SS1]
MGYIAPHALENLNKYKYAGVDKSILSKYVLQRWWSWFHTLWPATIAPNTITLCGLSAVFFNFATLVYYDPAYLCEWGGASGPPRWVYFTWAIGLFFYQSMDAIDGKQARKTGMAGPLGEMFDHGCDAINTTLELILTLRALNLGRSRWSLASQAVSLGTFYLTTWEEWHTGILYLGVFSGPVEGIIMVIFLYFFTGIYGPEAWSTPFFSLPLVSHVLSIHPLANFIPPFVLKLGVNEFLMALASIMLGYNIITSYMNVLHSLKPGQSALTPLTRLIPYVVTVVLHVSWALAPVNGSDIIHSASILPFMCFWGLQFAHQVGRMILAHLTKTPFPMWDSMWILSLIGTLDANSQFLFGRAPYIQSDPERSHLFVLASLAIAAISYVRFCTLVINDITEYLGIACFTVRKKDAAGEWKSAVKAQ